MIDTKKSTQTPEQTVGLVPIAAPSIYASMTTIMAVGNDFSLVFAKAHPAITADGKLGGVAVVVPAAVVSMSPQTAKDLYLSLKEVIPQYEKQFGQINTIFSEQQKTK